jgi:hypothetical protein
MAVIKIVPMPGAEGQQGETGAVGPQGPQGDTGATGPAGADAVWYYNGEYNPGASYVIGDVVTYDGQLWYRKHANGGNVGDTPSEGFIWDLLAAKGADGEPGLNGLEGPQGPQGEPGEPGITPTSGTWNPRFAELSDITYSDDASLHEFGNYYSIGDLVFFDVFIKLNNVQNWGNSIGFYFELPFLFEPHINGIFTGLSFSGTMWDHSLPENIEDRNAIDQGLHHLVAKGYHAGGNAYAGLYASAHDTALDTDGTIVPSQLRSVTKSFPAPLDQALFQEYSNIRVSGTYRRA